MLPKKAKTWELSGPRGAGFTWWHINSAFSNGQTLSLLDWSLNPESMLHYNMYFMYFMTFLTAVSMRMFKVYNTVVDRSNGPPRKGCGGAASVHKTGSIRGSVCRLLVLNSDFFELEWIRLIEWDQVFSPEADRPSPESSRGITSRWCCG